MANGREEKTASNDNFNYSPSTITAKKLLLTGGEMCLLDLLLLSLFSNTDKIGVALPVLPLLKTTTFFKILSCQMHKLKSSAYLGRITNYCGVLGPN